MTSESQITYTMACCLSQYLGAERHRPGSTVPARGRLCHNYGLETQSRFAALKRRQRVFLNRATSESTGNSSVQTTSVNNVDEDPNSMQGFASCQKYKGKTAVVVGAGPAGAAAALYLSRHGFTVKVFEKRGDLRFALMSSIRAYPIVLLPSVVEQMQDLGVDLPSREGGYVNGLHAFFGSWWTGFGSKPIPLSDQSNRAFGKRYYIAKAFLECAETHSAENVEFHFSHACADVSFPEQNITFRDRHGSDIKVDYDLLVAADGTNSVVRKLLSDFDKDVSINITPNRGRHMSVSSFHAPDDESLLSEITKPGWICFSGLRADDSGKTFKGAVVGMFRQDDGKVHVNLTGLPDLFQNIKEKGNDWTRQILPEEIPMEWKDKIYAAVKEKETGPSTPVIHVSRLTGPATVLIGDAGHALSPGIGLGCNLAVGDGKVLYEALDVANGDIDLALEAFNDMRYKEVRACQLLEEGYNQYALQRSGWFKVLWNCIVRIHTAVVPTLQRMLGQQAVLPPIRVTRNELSAREAVLMIVRDCMLLLSVALVAMFLLLRAVLKWTLMKGPPL